MRYTTAAAILARVEPDDLARAVSADTDLDGAVLAAVIADTTPNMTQTVKVTGANLERVLKQKGLLEETDNLSDVSFIPPDAVIELQAAAKRAVTLIRSAIDDASGDIDGYIANRYQLPLTNVPTKLKAVCNDLVIWRLLGGATQGDEKSERYQRVQDANKWLERLASGDISLDAQLKNAPSNNPGTVVVAGDAPVFDRDHLAAY